MKIRIAASYAIVSSSSYFSITKRPFSHFPFPKFSYEVLINCHHIHCASKQLPSLSQAFWLKASDQKPSIRSSDWRSDWRLVMPVHIMDTYRPCMKLGGRFLLNWLRISVDSTSFHRDIDATSRWNDVLSADSVLWRLVHTGWDCTNNYIRIHPYVKPGFDFMSGKCFYEAEIYLLSNGAPVYTGIHYYLPIVLMLLKFCLTRTLTASHPSMERVHVSCHLTFKLKIDKYCLPVKFVSDCYY